ncbi:glycosyltransferase family 1 protein [uncultured Bacteroides sp.]|uniref:glycosyltransferase family 1 protein n=1 Tax=uncultured Bacteroides sp. TaxID=162156 RepID=UPI002AAA742F|nr:glycosyltransferase family 1 protein [uncultured Bacteroides sp.]
MKALFLIFHGFEASNGISKKIFYQLKALEECDIDTHICYYNLNIQGHRKWMIDKEVLSDLGKGFLAKIKKRCYYNSIINYIKNEKISLVYIRSYHNANPFTIHLVKQIKENGAKVIMEIPTYPYDQEYIDKSMILELFIDKLFRKRLANNLNAIVTFSNEKIIFGQRTIRISNGIDFSAIKQKENVNDIQYELHLIGVAEVHYWHGFDRIIKGLGEFYRLNKNGYKVYFHIIGNLTGQREREEILTPLKQNKLEQFVILHGTKHGDELDDMFEQADFAIGSLGRHRSNISNIKTLKNREYAARGIPFIYSEIDDDFEKMPYILKASADDTPIDINKIVEFATTQKYTPFEIRNSIKHLSWKNQMEKVLNQL